MALRHWRYSMDDSGIGWLEIDVSGSSVNILRREVMQEWEGLMADISADKNLRGLCFVSGKAGGFVYGADIAEFEQLESEHDVLELLALADRILSQIEALPVPSVCGIDGVAVGGGLEIALPFDRIVATSGPKTQLGFPEINLGIMPGYGGTGRALRRIGIEKVLEMTLTGRMVSPYEALDWGLVDCLCATAGELRAVMREQLGHRRIGDWQPDKGKISAALKQAGAAFLAGRDEGQHPAPHAILSHYSGAGNGWRHMIDTEGRVFAQLLLGEASHHLRRMFMLSDAVRKSARGDSQIKHVHVIGAGTMGGDIAAVAAMNGFDVSLNDRDGAAVTTALARAQKLFARRLKSSQAVAEATARLTADTGNEGLERADLIIEAVAEMLEVKQALFSELEIRAKAGAIFATNTSSIMIEDIASALKQPDRLIGLHFFNPVPVLPLVEVISGSQSDPALVERAMYFSGQLKKMPIRVRSVKGFLVNRALLPYIYNAIVLMDAGMSADKIDQAMCHFGMPMGPIELADQVGLDVCYDVGRVLGMAPKAEQALRQRLEAGRLGRKSAQGFYQWDDKKAVRERALYDADELDMLARQLLAPMIEKCRSAVTEGIVASSDDADIGCVLGIGFPRHRGGPLGWADYPR